MAGSFKVPKLRKLEKKSTNLPTFEWVDFEKTKKIGSGTFGVVFLGKHRKRDEKVVVKKVKDESYDAKARCFKEAAF